MLHLQPLYGWKFFLYTDRMFKVYEMSRPQFVSRNTWRCPCFHLSFCDFYTGSILIRNVICCFRDVVRKSTSPCSHVKILLLSMLSLCRAPYERSLSTSAITTRKIFGIRDTRKENASTITTKLYSSNSSSTVTSLSVLEAEAALRFTREGWSM